jgi:hypothetical protein
MRMHLRSTVAIAALALATPSFAQGPGNAPGQNRQQEPSGIERPTPDRSPGNAGGADRGLERAQERAQDRAQERGLERAQERQPERSAQPARPAEERPDTPRPPRAAEPATPPSPAAPDRRNAESERPGRGNEARPEGQRNPRAAEPAQPAQPAQPQRDAQPNRPGETRPGENRTGEGRIEPARPRAAEPATPATPAPTQRDAQPSPTRTPAPGAPPATAQPSPSVTPQQPDSTAARTPATPDQQRAISETIERQVERQAVRPTRDIGVSVSVGTALPERVRIDRLPREIVDVRPQYRDYGVVVTERETVIVDPRTRRVVEVIGRGGGREADTVLVERIERGSIREWRNPRVEIREDVILPAEAPLAELPAEYIERTPRYRGYRYVASEDEIAIVEPRTRRVVQVIDRKQAKSGERSGDRSITTASTGESPLARDERTELNRMLLQRVAPGALFGMRDLRGSTLPESLELQRLPAAVAERSPSLRGMSYVLIGDDALIVDPESRRVVDVIE